MKIQKFLSYLMGWLSVLGWQSACAATSYIAATMIQGIAVLNYPNYVAENWHGTLLTMAIALLGVFINTVLAKKLPMLEGLVLGIHIFAFFGILVTLWVLAPRHSAKDVFTQFTDGGNWGSMGVATLVGVSSGISPLLGADAATHMAEEIRDAGRNIPLAMLTTTVVNGIMGEYLKKCVGARSEMQSVLTKCAGWVMTITFCFCLGSLTDILASPTGYPFIQVFYNVTGSAASATAMTSILIVINIFANMTTIATGSRQLYAFSRDKGFIFSSYFSSECSYTPPKFHLAWLTLYVVVSPSWELPMHAIWSTFIFSAVLSLINIGSPLALNSIISMATGANLSSYIVSIGCVCWRRLTGQPLLPSKFNLGRYGLLINLIAEAFLIVCFVFTFFPPAPHPDAPNMNWAIVAWGGVVCISLVHYYISGRHQYVGPVEYVRKLE